MVLGFFTGMFAQSMGLACKVENRVAMYGMRENNGFSDITENDIIPRSFTLFAQEDSDTTPPFFEFVDKYLSDEPVCAGYKNVLHLS
jgi:carbonic anhydrase